jgi:hypothetical protein
MKLPDEAFPQGPLPPSAPYDPFERSVLNAAEHGEDAQREELVHALLVGLPRPLTVPEKWAASEDHTRAPRVYAPASARVPKQPLPWDAELLAAGRLHTITAESAKHPGDRSDPSELR